MITISELTFEQRTLVGDYFESKNYEKVNELMAPLLVKIPLVNSDLEAEMTAIVALSCYNQGKFSIAISYSKALVNYMLKNGHSVAGIELFENMAVILVDSLSKCGRQLEAYAFIKRHRRRDLATSTEINVHYVALKGIILGRRMRIVTSVFIIAGIVLVILQNTAGPMDRVYMFL